VVTAAVAAAVVAIAIAATAGSRGQSEAQQTLRASAREGRSVARLAATLPDVDSLLPETQDHSIARCALSNPSIQKRQKERERQERARLKAEKRKARKDEKGPRSPTEDGVDPDIAGIVPGPQPPAEDFT
jgi:hypothetical protein